MPHSLVAHLVFSSTAPRVSQSFPIFVVENVSVLVENILAFVENSPLAAIPVVENSPPVAMHIVIHSPLAAILAVIHIAENSPPAAIPCVASTTASLARIPIQGITIGLPVSNAHPMLTRSKTKFISSTFTSIVSPKSLEFFEPWSHKDAMQCPQ
ncbi:hypothetical protein U1Q18_032387 [Sarracenia purpurea var. burkii]